MKNKFNESDFYREYKRIRNQFRKYDSLELLDQCFKFLYIQYPTKLDEISKKQPWQVLLLIKWILIDDNFLLRTKNKLSQNNFLKILQLIRNLGGKVRMPTEYSHHILFFRNISYQQLIYQIDFNINTFARQIVLFSNLDRNHYIKSSFRNSIGMDIDDFLELSIYLITRFIRGIKPVGINWFSSLYSHYGKETISTFLDNISLDLEGAREYLLQEPMNRKVSYEFYEQTPLIRYPMLRFNQKYYPYDLNILYRGIEYFIYDSVREINPERFMNKFGSIFEEYVRKNLIYANVNYKDENDLSKIVGQTSKVVDFLIQEKGKSIFIDAKGVEMNYIGKVSHQPDIILQKVKSSALKGLQQAYELIYNLRNTDPTLISNNNEDNYLLIITYKELYLGNGKNFEESIASDFIYELVESHGGEYLIPMKNIYFISIDSFEIWIELIKKNKITFTEGLDRAISDDMNPQKMKFDFIQHVTEWDEKGEIPEFLIKEFNAIFDKGLKILKNR